MPFGIVACTFSNNLSRNSCILALIFYCLPHPVLSLLFTNPGLHVISDERCLKEDLSAVLLTPCKLILNCPVEIAYCIWNSTASLFSLTSSVIEADLTALINNENNTSIPSTTALLVFWRAVQPHSGTEILVRLQALGSRHPAIVERVSATSCSKAEWISLGPRLTWHPIPINFTERWCSIFFGFALPDEKNHFNECLGKLENAIVCKEVRIITAQKLLLYPGALCIVKGQRDFIHRYSSISWKNITIGNGILQCEYYNRGHLDKVDQSDLQENNNTFWKLFVNHNYHETK